MSVVNLSRMQSEPCIQFVCLCHEKVTIHSTFPTENDISVLQDVSGKAFSSMFWHVFEFVGAKIAVPNVSHIDDRRTVLDVIARLQLCSKWSGLDVCHISFDEFTDGLFLPFHTPSPSKFFWIFFASSTAS